MWLESLIGRVDRDHTNWGLKFVAKAAGDLKVEVDLVSFFLTFISRRPLTNFF